MRRRGRGRRRPVGRRRRSAMKRGRVRHKRGARSSARYIKRGGIHFAG